MKKTEFFRNTIENLPFLMNREYNDFLLIMLVERTIGVGQQGVGRNFSIIKEEFFKTKGENNVTT